MKITPEMTRRNIQIGGVILTAPTPYASGHVLNDNEAAALNQTFHENVGNNFRSKVTAAKRAAIAGPDAKPEALKAVTDAQLKAFDDELEAGTKSLPTTDLQSGLDTLIDAYEMGVRRSSSVEVLDPITKAARAIAKDKLKASLSKKGIKLNTVKPEWWTREIDKLLNKEAPVIKGDNNITDGIWTTATRQVNLMQAAAKEGLDDLDLTDAVKTPAAEGAKVETTTDEVKEETKPGKKGK